MKEKLVRDNIQFLSQKDQDGATFRVATHKEMPELFSKKLHEECAEVVEQIGSTLVDCQKLAEELADLMEVIDGICHHYKIEKHDLLKIKEDKKIKKGSFILRSVRKA